MKDIPCIYRASSVEQADIVLAWLAERGIAAFVNDRNMVGGYATLAVAPKGIEVCVPDPSEAARAEDLLKEHFQLQKEHRESVQTEKVVRVICQECGRQVEFPGELFGTVQSCPGCRENVDVGEPPHFC